MANHKRSKKSKASYKYYGPNSSTKKSVNGLTSRRSSTTGESDEEDEVERSVFKSSQAPETDCSIAINVISEDIKHKKKEVCEVFVNSNYFEKPGVSFPTELWNLILFFTTAIQIDPKYLLVCKQFYHIYLPFLYDRPILDPTNFLMFVETIGKPRSKIGSFVHHLDLSTIVQSGKNSHISKLLRRCSSSLKTFVAPQTSFGYAPLVSLRNCKNLKVLDLGLVSETVNLDELLHAIQNLTSLTHLKFPRSSIEIDMKKVPMDLSCWPSNLWYLRLSGGVTDDFVMESTFPQTIKRLEFAHCPKLRDFSIYNMLHSCGRGLTHLSIQYPMPGLTENSMDYIFTCCPDLVFLQINVDYCSRFLFSEDLLPPLYHKERPLKTLWLDSSGGLGQSSKIHPDDLIIAIMEDRLPCLKNVRVTVKLGWDFKGDDVSDLINLLEEKDGGLYINY